MVAAEVAAAQHSGPSGARDARQRRFELGTMMLSWPVQREQPGVVADAKGRAADERAEVTDCLGRRTGVKPRPEWFGGETSPVQHVIGRSFARGRDAALAAGTGDQVEGATEGKDQDGDSDTRG